MVQYPPFNVSLSLVQQSFYSQLLPRNIAYIYDIIICIYRLFIDYSISEINIQHSMLALHKEK